MNGLSKTIGRSSLLICFALITIPGLRHQSNLILANCIPSSVTLNWANAQTWSMTIGPPKIPRPALRTFPSAPRVSPIFLPRRQHLNSHAPRTLPKVMWRDGSRITLAQPYNPRSSARRNWIWTISARSRMDHFHPRELIGRKKWQGLRL